MTAVMLKSACYECTYSVIQQQIKWRNRIKQHRDTSSVVGKVITRKKQTKA